MSGGSVAVDDVHGLLLGAEVPGAAALVTEQLAGDVAKGGIVVDEEEAAQLALNSVSDGRHVIVSESAPRYIRQLLSHGYTPVPVDLSELLKGGGGIKSCTQELRR